MKANRARLIWIPLGLILAVFGYFAVRAYLQIVTLDVQNADIRQVIRKIERQVWRSILVNRDIRGQITLHVRNMPLEEVFSLLEQQTGARWTLMYPLYSTRKNLDDFRRAVRGELALERSGWTNLALLSMDERPEFRRGARVASQFAPVSLQLTNCELRLVILALNRFGNCSIVPMNDTDGKLSFQLENAALKKAVKYTAKGLHRKWTSYYALLAPNLHPPELAQGPEGGPDSDFPFPPNGPPPPGMEDDGSAAPPPPPAGMFMPPRPPPTKEQQQQREADYKILMGILPPAQRAQMEMERKMGEALQSAPPEQHQQIIQEVTGQSSDETEQRNKGLLTTTPRQRVNFDRMEKQTRNAQNVQSKKDR